jgi:hypothetical protein
MSKAQTAMARAVAAPSKSSPRPLRVAAAVRAVPRPVLDEVQLAVMRVKIVWFAMLANTFIIPALIVFIAATYDVVAWKASIGAFIIAAGAVSICASFPVADRFRATNNEINKDYQRSRNANPEQTSKMMRLLLIGAVLAELPSIAGLVHFFATHEIIASLLLCAPAIGLMLVAYQPVEPRLMPKAPEPSPEAN